MKRLILSLLIMVWGTSVMLAQTEMDEESRTRLLAKSDSLFARGVDLYNASNYTEAIPVFAECDSIDNAILPKENYRRVHSTMWLASCYYQLGDTLKASEAFPYYEYSPVDRRLTVKHDSLCTLGFVAYKKHDFKSALAYLAQCADIEKSIVGENHMIYMDVLWKIAISYSYLAFHNSELGKYSEAIRLETEALNVWEELFGSDDDHYTGSLTDLASYYASLGNYSEAIRLATKVLNTCEKAYGKEYLGCADALKDLASYYAAGSGNYSEAIRFATEALNIEKKALGEEHLSCATILNDLASYYADLGNYSEAIRLSTEALNIHEKDYLKEHPNYATSLSNLASYSFKSGNSQLTDYYTIQTSELCVALVRKAFALQTTAQRATSWRKYSSWYETSIHCFAYCMPSDTLALNGCDGVLFSKGLLLNSEIEFSKLIQESGDDEALAMYEDLKRTRTQVNKLREEFSSADSIKLSYLQTMVDSLSRESDKIEKELVSRSKVYGDYTKNLVIAWDQVQEQLTDKDIAVEFVSFPLNADSTMYIAYAIKKDWEYPKMIPLFEEKQLKDIYPDEYYTTTAVSRLVWEPLKEVLEGVETVYFAPSGELYNIAIESVPDYSKDDMSIVSDSRNYYRLSSTRELALIKDEDKWNTAAVYGGLKYGMTAESLTADSRSFCSAVGSDIALTNEPYNIADTLSMMRGGELAELLPGTLIEAEAIDKSLETSGVSSTLYTDSIGTEASFKNLSGKKTSIMHIGTHGFYWTEKEARNLGYKFLMNDETSGRYVEDKQLTRSGLLFAGANYALSGKENQLPEGVDDGILTAKELTTIDLRGLDLVVLSACQTGLGEITGDGVFGLQRGFKKAGAQTIVMSLWKVNDEATRLFMTKFFETMKLDKEGHPTNKHEAFLAAQRYLRDEYEIEQTRTINSNLTASQIRRLEREGKSVETQTITERVKPYAAPKYWAAFIMLDGVN